MSRVTTDFIAEKARSALAALGFVAKTEVLIKAAEAIQAKSGCLMDPSPESSFYAFEDKALANAQFFKKQGIKPTEWAKACLEQPQLFSQSPETIHKNFEDNLVWQKTYGIKPTEWAKACLKRPSLFCQSPETIRKNFEDNLVWQKAYGIKPTEWANACLKQPQLFCQSPETICKNFEDNVAWQKAYGIKPTEWAKACLEQPQLFSQSPETIRKNFEDNLVWQKTYGIKPEEWAKTCLKQPSLFYQSPKRIRKHFEDNLAWQKTYGIKPTEWANACLKQPSHFCQSPETIRKNFEDNLAWQKAYGIKPEEWAKACVKHSPLFSQSPETLRKKFHLVMVLLESSHFYVKNADLTQSFRKTRVDALLKMPIVLSLSTENILLRLAFAEMEQKPLTAGLLARTRGHVQNELLKSFSFAGSEVTKTLKKDPALSAIVHDYASSLCADHREKAAPTEPVVLPTSILSVLGGENKTNPLDNQQTLLRKLVQSGLLNLKAA